MCGVGLLGIHSTASSSRSSALQRSDPGNQLPAPAYRLSRDASSFIALSLRAPGLHEQKDSQTGTCYEIFYEVCE